MKCITKSGCGRDEVYKSTWFAFNHMTFLLDKFQPRATYNTDATHVSTYIHIYIYIYIYIYIISKRISVAW